MKHTLIATLIGSAFTVAPVMADAAAGQAPAPVASTQSIIAAQVAKDVKASPTKAAEIVKAAILQSKASPVEVAQIVRAAIDAAPKQWQAIYNVSLAVAPDAQREIDMVIAAIRGGDQVAGEGSKSGKEVVSNAGKPMFSMPSDLSVDDHNKYIKVIGENEGDADAWSDDDSRDHEVKLDDFPYINTPGVGGTAPNLPHVIIIPNDTQLFSKYFPFFIFY